MTATGALVGLAIQQAFFMVHFSQVFMLKIYMCGKVFVQIFL